MSLYHFIVLQQQKRYDNKIIRTYSLKNLFLSQTHSHTVPFWTPPLAALCSLINILISRKDEGLILINKGHMQHGRMRREQIIFPDTSYIIRLTLSNALFTMQNTALTAITLTRITRRWTSQHFPKSESQIIFNQHYH